MCITDSDTVKSHAKTIRSFVRHQGRMTRLQSHALKEFAPAYLIQTDYFDSRQIFANDKPVWLDIGFGMGESCLHFAQTFPLVNILGFEVYQPGVGKLCANIQQKGISNIKIMDTDFAQTVANTVFFPKNCIEKAIILHPDPWPKKRHHKRRLINQPFLQALYRILQPHGSIHIVTDSADYAQHIQTVIQSQKLFCESKEEIPIPDTSFRRKAIQQQRQIHTFALEIPAKTHSFYDIRL